MANVNPVAGNLTFQQNTDACSEGDQFLNVEIADGGGGPYYIIKTDRWAFNDISDLVAILEKVKCAFKLEG